MEFLEPIGHGLFGVCWEAHWWAEAGGRNDFGHTILAGVLHVDFL